MYSVEAEVLKVDPSSIYPEWQQIHALPQRETEQQELQEARNLAALARKYYAAVRITKTVSDTVRKVVT